MNDQPAKGVEVTILERWFGGGIWSLEVGLQMIHDLTQPFEPFPVGTLVEKGGAGERITLT